MTGLQSETARVCARRLAAPISGKTPRKVCERSVAKGMSMFLRYKITSGDEQREALQKVRAHLNDSPESARMW